MELFKYLNLICVIFYWRGGSLQTSTSRPLSALAMTCKGASNLSHSAKTVARAWLKHVRQVSVIPIDMLNPSLHLSNILALYVKTFRTLKQKQPLQGQ